MLNRRKFLLMAFLTAITPILESCSSSNNSLAIRVLKDSIPPQLLGNFQKQFPENRPLDIKPIPQLKSLYELLEKLSQEDNQKTANLVTLGDIWLEEAIAENLIQPLDLTSVDNWRKLPSVWQRLVQRDAQGNLAPNGKIWGAPYRWGNTVIAYRADQFREAGYEPITDWKDLWREELRDRVSLLNQPREVIGFTLKKLGQSYNTSDLEQVPNLKTELATLHQQVKFYSSQAYLQPLVLEDTWVAVGWSSDILQLQTRYPDLTTVIPESGTSLWADVWVQPTGKPSLSEAMLQWINFCWEEQAATQIGLFTNASSPILLNTKTDQLPESLQQDQLRIPPQTLIEKSEFLLPLSAQTKKQYQQLWREMRTNTSR
ncbi:periplasmic polyamine-binding protein [Halothece sp. PCC 7418]|uniref:extracellular solute-binding protein n=1 Tax=Halothece sp. (strain PCC 7418) TaxID=65093 RepID=UPI0002A08454|nr:extracellular solute-binding protein [Halothece sp. PCC 7418]AFZ42631.1 periplasmic polyamine-binding protein [Halothece sp. PCC 7418]